MILLGTEFASIFEFTGGHNIHFYSLEVRTEDVVWSEWPHLIVQKRIVVRHHCWEPPQTAFSCEGSIKFLFPAANGNKLTGPPFTDNMSLKN